MTTSKSSEKRLRQQATLIIQNLKSVAGGNTSSINDPAGKLKASLESGQVTFGIVMDDKVVKVTMEWDQIKNTNAIALVEWIVSYMKGETAN